jgi:hypothetical protein
MRREELACLFLGSMLLVGGATVAFWPAGLMVAGLLLLLVAWDRLSA